MQQISKELEEKIKNLLKQNNIVEAMKEVMQKLQLGLREAKDVVDKYR